MNKQAKALAAKLREWVKAARTKPTPLVDLIPLVQEAADFLDVFVTETVWDENHPQWSAFIQWYDKHYAFSMMKGACWEAWKASPEKNDHPNW